MQKVGTRLFRGFNELAQVEDRVPDISHLCFVIHGIGQKMGRNPILRNCNELRVTCEKIKARFFPHLDEQNKRVEFLPIEWRTSLQLDGDTVESITPVHVQGLRTVLNSSAMDIMYYTSPLYRTEIISSLKSELNRLYDMFRRLNPDFESRGGKVSIIAHSLGCVLIYDLITGWNQLLDNDQLTEILLDKSTHGRNISFNTDSSKSSENVDKHVSTNNTDEEVYHDCRADMISTSGNLEQITRVSFQLDAARTLVNNLEQELNSLIVADEHPMSNSLHKSNIDNQSASDTSMPCINSSLSQPNTLLFANNLENFFCLGSPLGVYLVLRGIRPGPFQTQDTILPRKICPRIFNIYHPADPVAYRLEPLILKYYSNIQPVMIHRTDAVSKPCYDSLPLIAYSGKELKHPKSQDYFQQPVKNASDTNHLTVQDGCTDSSRRFSIASRLFGFFSRTASSPTHENDVIDFSLSENTYDHTPLKTTFELFSDDEEKPYSMPNHSNSCKSTDKNESNISLSNPSCNDPVENGFYLESLQLEHRLDFELRASRYENLYISLLTSHTNYWSNTDICMFIMTYLFPQSPGSSN
ncbi:unnamed protein product [Heterobilharzia americana]|nr:unnamed protein product [Heterobilharzia americana]